MLDIHLLRHAPKGLRDFLLHIATIVIGLLIAIGLEQSVEWIHRKHQARDAREAIAQERVLNRRLFARMTDAFRVETKRLQMNLAVLEYVRRHSGAPPSMWPGEINWHIFITPFSTSAWDTAEHSGVTALLPQTEVRASDRLYHSLRIVQASSTERLRAISAARRYTTFDSDPSRLTPAQLVDEIALAESVLVAHYRLGGDMRNLHTCNPEFEPSPTTDELLAIVHESAESDDARRRGANGVGSVQSGCFE